MMMACRSVALWNSFWFCIYEFRGWGLGGLGSRGLRLWSLGFKGLGFTGGYGLDKHSNARWSLKRVVALKPQLSLYGVGSKMHLNDLRKLKPCGFRAFTLMARAHTHTCVCEYDISIFYVCIHIYIYMYRCMYVCMYVRIYVCMYVRMFVCKWIFMYVCMYVTIHIIQAHTHAESHRRSKTRCVYGNQLM